MKRRTVRAGLERLHNRIDVLVDPQFPREHIIAGFRRDRSTQTIIECSFQHKVGVVYFDMAAAYDTMWNGGLHLKLRI